MISSRATALTFETCHQPLSWSSALTRSISGPQLAVAAVGEVDPHPRDGFRWREARLLLGLFRNRLLDPSRGLLVEAHMLSLTDRV